MMEFVSGKDYPIYEMENKKCLETTNQIIFSWILLVGSIPTPLQKNKVSWDYDLPNIWKGKIHVPNHQPDYDEKYDE